MADLYTVECSDCSWRSGYVRGIHAAMEKAEEHEDVWHDHKLYVEPVGGISI